MATDTVPDMRSDPAPRRTAPSGATTRAMEPATTLEEPQPAAVTAVRCKWLVQRDGPFWDRGRVFEFPSTINEGTIGRSSSCHWRINDPSVSRLHAALVRKPRRGVYLLDLASREGTFLNGERVTGEVLLMDGDRISLGRRVILEFVDGVQPQEGPERRLWRRLAWSLAGATTLCIAVFLVF